MGYKMGLITDSACDLPDAVLAQYDIEMVPLYVIWGTEELRDRVDISGEEFYRRLVSDPVHPKTSQPTPEDFAAGIRRLVEGGAEEVVILTISGAMSSTYNAAEQGAARVPGVPIHVVDTRANSMSQGWQVLAAARAREEGGDAQAMIAAADRVRSRLATTLYVDTLEYLHRGGRIGAAARFVGAALNIKPQLYVNHQTGEVEAGPRVRTRRKAVEAMIEAFCGQMDRSRPIRVAVLHGNVPDEVKALAERIRHLLDPVEIVIGLTSPVLGVHTGPGALALCGYYEA